MKKLLFLFLFTFSFMSTSFAQDEFDVILNDVIEDMCECSQGIIQITLELHRKISNGGEEDKETIALYQALEEENMNAEQCMNELEGKYKNFEEEMDRIAESPDFDRRMRQTVKEVCPELYKMMEMGGF